MEGISSYTYLLLIDFVTSLLLLINYWQSPHDKKLTLTRELTKNASEKSSLKKFYKIFGGSEHSINAMHKTE